MLILLAAVLMGMVPPPPVQINKTEAPSATAKQADPQKLALAAEVVDLAGQPDGGLAQEMRGWEIGLQIVLKRDPAISAIEKDRPGASAAAIEAARPIAREYLQGMVTKVRAMRIEAAASRLTLDELRVAREFFMSPAGQRFVAKAGKVENVDVLLRDAAGRAEETGDMSISLEDASKAVEGAVGIAMGGSSTEDKIAVLKFDQTGAAAKLREVAAEVLPKIVAMSNAPDPDFLKAQNEAMVAGLLAFLEGEQK